MPLPHEKQAGAIAASGVAAAAAPARSAKKGVGLWLAFCVLCSLILVFMIVSPLLITLWGSFTTSDIMGASSAGGPGWEAITTSRAERDAERAAEAAARAAGTAGAGAADMGVFAKGARNIAGEVTTFWFRYVWEIYGQTIRLSLMLAAISIVTCIVLGVLGGYVLVRYNFFGKNLLEELILLPLSLPGIAVAVALIETYGIMRGSWVIILFGHLLYTLPFMMQSVTGTLRSFDFVTLEQAAASMGAGAWQRLRYILLPNLKHAIVIGSLLVFAISIGEFNASFLLNTPFNQTFPAALFDSYTNDGFQVSSASTTIFMAIVIPALLSIQFIGGREMKEAGAAA